MIDDLREQNLKSTPMLLSCSHSGPTIHAIGMGYALLVFIGPDSIFVCVKVLPKANKHPAIYNRVNNGNAGMDGCKLQQRSTESSTSLQRVRPVRE